MDFNTLNEMLGDRIHMKVANNTRLYRIHPDKYNGDAIAVRLWDTDVVTYHADGRIILNSAGYKTVTTKRRMNDWTPSSVMLVQEDFDWYVIINRAFDARFPYFDGMDVSALVIAAERMDEIERELKARASI